MLRIALCQYEIIWEDKERNQKKIESFIEQAKQQQGDMILLPEMSLTGFSMNVEKTRDTYVNETIGRFQELCQKWHIIIGFGWVEQSGDKKARNHYTIVDKEGKIASDYVKIHPFRFGREAEYFEGGNSFMCCNVGEHKIATAICYDLRFPELFRVFDKECSIVVIPANWPAARKEHWNCLLQARAIENQIYVIGINCVGTMNGVYYSGNSACYNPLGKQIAEVHDKEALLMVEISNDVEEYREQFPVRKDQRIIVKRGLGNGGDA